ncbi:hypothetical protein B4U80_13163 [Leptotrombidium deliense]|uniref:Peptidase S1 domain-containing protein n=1 Tax=Leptotrombidium deliense TaxID=299467 RepID=A0A443SBD3_9ACAR|nr:hypothetical protein B4U80_13163 [Leptotrombidium deliense]
MFTIIPWASYLVSLIFSQLLYHSILAVKCGQNIDTNSGFRIVGGKAAAQGQVPWQVSVKVGAGHVCGGSIIAPNCVLTAAHCLDKYDSHANNTYVDGTRKYYVVAGSLIKRNGYKVGQQIEIDKIIFHPKYNRKTLFADVLLLKLKSSFQYRSSPKNNPNATAIGPICLPDVNSKEWDYKGVAKVSGFGRMEHKGNQSQVLRFITEKVLDEKLCMKKYERSNFPYDPKTMLCYGSLREGIATCQVRIKLFQICNTI